MAKYFVDVNQQPSGNPVPGWTGRIIQGSTFQQNGSNLRLNSTTAGTNIYGFNAVDGVTDNIEILVRFKLSSDYGKQGIASLRYSGTSEATTKGYTLSGSFISSAGTLAVDEGSTGYASWTAWNYLANVWYWARFRVDGSRIRAKVWNDGSSEPAWMLDFTNTVTSTGSYNGVHTYNTGAVDYSQISFGTNGDTAPSTIVDIIPSTASTPGAQGGGFGSVLGYGYMYGTDNIITVVNTVLSPNNDTHSITSDNIDLQQQHTLVINNSSHTTQVDSFTITQVHNLSVNSGTHSVTSDNVVITETAVLAVSNASHSVSSPNISLIGGTTLTVGSTSHATYSDVLDLVQAQTLVTDDSTHSQSVNSVDVVENTTLSVASAHHAHTVSSVTVHVYYTMEVDDVSHDISSDSIFLLQSQIILTYSATHGTTSDNIDLQQFTLLSVPDSSVIGVSDKDARVAKDFHIVVDSTSHTTKVGNVTIINLVDYDVYSGRYNKGWGNAGSVEQSQAEYGYQYQKNTNTNGSLDNSEDTDTGLLNRNFKSDGELDQYLAESGQIAGANGILSGSVVSNDIYTILQFEDLFDWVSEDYQYIMVEEYDDSKILKTVTDDGIYKRVIIDNGIL